MCRCSLCRGAGVVGWEGKWSHKELCPSCLGKRFVSCPHCGGHPALPIPAALCGSSCSSTPAQRSSAAPARTAAAVSSALLLHAERWPITGGAPASSRQHRLTALAAVAAGGHFHRPTFVHARCRGRADALASMDDDGSSDAFLAVRWPPLEEKVSGDGFIGSAAAILASLAVSPRPHAHMQLGSNWAIRFVVDIMCAFYRRVLKCGSSTVDRVCSRCRATTVNAMAMLLTCAGKHCSFCSVAKSNSTSASFAAALWPSGVCRSRVKQAAALDLHSG